MAGLWTFAVVQLRLPLEPQKRCRFFWGSFGYGNSMLGRPGRHSPISSNLTPRNEISVLSKMKTNCICQTFAPMKDIMSANTRDTCTMIKTQFIPSSIQDSHSAPCSSFKPWMFLFIFLNPKNYPSFLRLAGGLQAAHAFSARHCFSALSLRPCLGLSASKGHSQE